MGDNTFKAPQGSCTYEAIVAVTSYKGLIETQARQKSHRGGGGAWAQKSHLKLRAIDSFWEEWVFLRSMIPSSQSQSRADPRRIRAAQMGVSCQNKITNLDV